MSGEHLMNPRINSALLNCETKESAVQKAMKTLEQVKGYAIPVALTVGAGIAAASIPLASSTMEFIGTAASNLAAFKSAEPGIFYGLAAGLVALGGSIAGVGLLEGRDSNKSNQSFIKVKEINESILNAWDNIVRNNTDIAEKAANLQMWVSIAASKGSSLSRKILEESGIDVNNRQVLIDIQRAYIHGVKYAFVKAEQDGRRAEFGAGVFDQYTNKNILRGMVSFFNQSGSKFGINEDVSVNAAALARQSYDALIKISQAQTRSGMYKRIHSEALER